MPADISASGTFTGLATDLAAYEDVLRPQPTTVSVHHSDLESVPDEIRQMIRVFQDGWGAQIGSGKRLDFWVTVRLLDQFLQVYKQTGVPRSGDRLA